MYIPVTSRATNAYRQVGVASAMTGASPHDLIMMLFNGLIESLHEARGAMKRQDVELKGRLIRKAVRILEEGLRGSLNLEQGGEVAQNLDVLYAYCCSRLTAANLNNDEALIVEVCELLEPVASGWKAIGE